MARERVVVRPVAHDPAERAAILARARIRGFRRFVLAEAEAAESADPSEILREVEHGFRDPTGAVVPVVRVASEAELAAAVTATGAAGTLAVEWTADRVIPLENAVAARRDRFALWTVARTPREVPGALGALEHGADLVIVEIRTPEEIDELERLVEGPLPAALDWQWAPLTGVAPAGVGDRVLVDTTSLLRPEEGLLVGSAAAYLFHVPSEAEGSRFSRPRPFRVNAGAAHSYVLRPDGTTRYLSELEPGDAVLVATPDGPVRSVRVGRIKVERRPLVVLTVLDGKISRTLFAQEAESVRVTTDKGRESTATVRAGVRIRGVRLPPARHLGVAIEEAIEER